MRPSGIRSAVAAIVAAVPIAFGIPVPARAAPDPHAAHAAHGVPMTDEAMARWVKDWFATHPRVGERSLAAQATANVTVSNFIFDADGSAATQVDTVRIDAMDTVQWNWVAGGHTVTSGKAGSFNAGSLFDQPSDLTHPVFAFQFTTPGIYDYHCRPHGVVVNMIGVVVVRSPVGVGPDGERRIGFLRDPSPNPTSGGASFSFALPQRGRARVEVLDVRGRRVAVALDRELDAGAHVATWDGRDARGRAAGVGVYVVRLSLPGHVSSRRLVVSR